MPLSQSLASGRKRREPLHPPTCGCEFERERSRGCKKQRKLDSINDFPSYRTNTISPDSALRRSSRLRGNPAPAVPAPLPSKLKTENPNPNKDFENRKNVEKEKEKGKGKSLEKVSESPSSGEWDSRLRPRGKNVGSEQQNGKNVGSESQKRWVEKGAKRKLLKELSEAREVDKKVEVEVVEIDDRFDNGVSWARKSRRVARIRVSKSGEQVTGSSGCAQTQSDDGLLQGGFLKSNEEEEISPLKNSSGGGSEVGIGYQGNVRSNESYPGANVAPEDECQDLTCQEKTEDGEEDLQSEKVVRRIECDRKDLENAVSHEFCDLITQDHVDVGNEHAANLCFDEQCTNNENFKSSETLSEKKCTDVTESHIGMDNLPSGNEHSKNDDTHRDLSSSTVDASVGVQASIDLTITPTVFSMEKLESGSHENMEANPCPDLALSCPVELENESLADVPKSNLILSDKISKPGIREGRRCGLCGGGVDGQPPKRLFQDSAGSDNEAYDRLSPSEEPNYNVWDGFGDEPGWLGRLLGPIHDRYGIAGVWVHQHCAVWSPEVYFAGLGCLKNVRAALCRGRALKCSRCGRRGATIGCRVDRCPRTYHLPCARADGSIFDHRKFLIACADHLHLFQPQGNQYMRRIKKMKTRKMKLDSRKLANDAWRKDLETEEKWLENCGEDEEFLRREGKRLHRDILRIAPVYIGGSSSDGDKLYQGWESIAGLQDVIRCMKEVVILPLLYPDFFNNLGLTPPRGVLLHGYPGTGKTLVVRALVGACSRGDKRIAYFARKGADCLGKYVGDAERQLRLLFQVAEKSQPSIIFFDEIDGLAPMRSRQQDQTHSSVVSTLLALLDGLKSRGSVIVIGATNRPEAVDPALRRPGRFDREIYFPLPSVKDRAAILALHTQRWPKPVSGSFLTKIAKQTAGFAGADLQALCTQAAMIALKRNCALNELLYAAESYRHHGIRHSLPSFLVEERDWLTALACVPPPCSRREAGMAANHVVSSPIHSHLVSYLMQPLLELLVSLYLDHHIVLPPTLYKAAELIEGTLTSALKQKGICNVSWWANLRNLIHDPDVAKDIARNLSRVGLLVDTSSDCTLDQFDDDDGSNSGLYKLNPSGPRMFSTSMHNSYPARKSLGFRVLIAGTPKSGQRHLASCILHGFEGHIEIKKVDLATISQEGHGDMVQGVTHILLKCHSIGPCIVYMPRIDLWAPDERSHQSTEKGTYFSPETCEPVEITEVCAAENDASLAWNSLVEQVDSMSDSSLMILATYETANHVLPLKIRQFFTSDVLNSTNLVPSKESIPRFYVRLDGNFNRDAVIDASTDKLSWDLAQRYVEMIHGRTHAEDASKELKFSDSVEVHSDAKNPVTDNQSTSSKDNKAHQYENGDGKHSSSKTTSHQEGEIWLRSHQDSNSRIPQMVKGKSTLQLAIATFGYQILRYPHFSELCWATSKLIEGPCTGINGPWKGWPFNSCIVYADTSSEAMPVGEILNQRKGTERYSSVRGLVAVGLLAYRGMYKSAREISFDVRKVLELLVGQINARILDRKDRRFLRLLSQVAYLEDIVTSWAYTIQSLDVSNRQSGSSTRPLIEERLNTDNHVDVSTLVNDASCPTNMPKELKLDMHEHIPEKFAPENTEFADLKGPAHLGLPNSNTWCSYDCCTECIHDLHLFTRKFLLESLESDGCCSTIDDVHDVVASCSTSLLYATSKLVFAKSLECNYHLRSKNTGAKTAFMISLFDPGLKVICRDHETVPLKPTEDVQFHCKLEHICLSSLIEMFKINRPRG